MKKSRLIEILENVCEQIGVKLYYDKNFGHAGYVEFSSGKRSYFRETAFDINGQGACNIAKDKNYCAQFLKNAGFTTPEEILVFSPRYREKLANKNDGIKAALPNMSAMIAFIERHGFPLFVKPNEGTQGQGVVLAGSMDDLFDTVCMAFLDHERVLIQKPVQGRDYRVVVLDGAVTSAYERIPFTVRGDGARTVRALMDEGFQALAGSGREQSIPHDDPRIAETIRAKGFDFSTVLPKGITLGLLPNANLSAGGGVVDVTTSLHPDVAQVCIRACSEIGLRFAGVDILCADAEQAGQDITILEMNSAPGFSNYTSLGPEQVEAVTTLYTRILQAIEKTHG